MEAKFPPRNLKEGVRVTRLAPSPTGFLHFGNLFAGTVAYRTAKTTDGIFFVRVEDTDQKRKIEGAVKVMLDGLEAFGVTADEGVIGEDMEKGDYGPYYQSKRKDIYHVFAKTLVEKDLAYPCFCSAEELDEIRAQQENEPQKGYWGKYAKCRNLSFDEIAEKISAGAPWTLRLKSPGNAENKCFIDDMIKGKIEMPENVQDIVLLKSDGIPTYHFAHAVDDHLMRTTHVVRGDEWMSSCPVHLQLFKCLGFKVPKYAHVAPIMKEENGGKRKLSKRKDPEAAVTFYIEQGYPKESVNEYMMTLMNSNFEDWRKTNKDASIDAFPFNLKKMSVSGALFDMVKFNDVSKNVISLMSADKVYGYTAEWAKEYDADFYAILTEDPAHSTAILGVDRDTPKPRKDIACWSEVKDYISYYFDELFDNNLEMPENITADMAKEILEAYIAVYNENDSKDEWFQRMKDICEPLGYTPNVKEFKKNPEAFKGHVGDVSTVIRIALTSRKNTPDLYSIMQLLGEDEIKARLAEAIASF
ncbi:MAG: glutamate--tRNA ligase, partial [Clostridia bacterium]|nr:glutamate--tRNA ligase [Clostridia bacterium]